MRQKSNHTHGKNNFLTLHICLYNMWTGLTLQVLMIHQTLISTGLLYPTEHGIKQSIKRVNFLTAQVYKMLNSDHKRP